MRAKEILQEQPSKNIIIGIASGCGNQQKV